MQGVWGKILCVDLTNHTSHIENIDENLYEQYLGGAGLAAKLLYDRTDAQTDPLGPNNPLIAFTGPFTGTKVPSSSRHHIVAMSPLTGIFGETNVGGSWSVHFKKNGYDGLIVTGCADTPVYLWIHDDGVEIRDAQPIWGKDSYESAVWIKKETLTKATVSVIGQAGEKQVLIASIPHIGHIVRAAARTGLGAVMGSKNLKAVAVFGTKKIPVADADGLAEDIRSMRKHITTATKVFRKYGTSGGIDTYEKIGNFPIKNWRDSRWEGASKISGVSMHDTILTGPKACFKCPIACGRHIKIRQSSYGPMEGEGPEYESIGTLGGECMVDDLAAICKANLLCNQYGLDTISTGATIAFAMEAFEKGLITTKDTDGIALEWGSGEALVAMVHQIGRQDGLGPLLGQGSKKMAEALGNNTQEFAIHVKGLEPSAHDPRRFFSQALSYGTAARGACHNASWSHAYELAMTMPELGIETSQDPYDVDGKAEFTAKLQDMNCFNDALVICRFTQVGKAVSFIDTIRWFNFVTGQNLNVNTALKIGERIFTLKRMYNTRLGISRKDDFLPLRFLTQNRKGEELTNQLPPMGQLLSNYYEFRQWNEEGIPSADKIKELKITAKQNCS